MSHTGLCWLRAVLGALVSALALLVPLTVGARAELKMESLSTQTVDEEVHWMNSYAPHTSGNYQFIAYWSGRDREGRVYVKLRRRNLTTNATESVIFNGVGGTSSQSVRELNDGHNTVGLGLSPNNGRIHMSWSEHHKPHHYGFSSERCIEATRLSECTFNWETWQTPEVRSRETFGGPVEIERVLTYPFYFNDRSGHLYMTFRFGESARGDQYLNAYEERTNTWRSKGLILQGRELSGARPLEYTEPGGTRITADQRGVYPSGMAFDKNDRLHVIWVWKELPNSRNANGRDQHGMYYAFSDDGGTTWKYDNGRPEGRTFARSWTGEETRDPIEVEDSETLVYNAPFGSYPFFGYLTVDSNNLPNLVLSKGEPVTADEARMETRLTHLWRTEDGRWYANSVEPAAHGSESIWPGIIFDGADNLYVIYARNGLGWGAWNTEGFTLRQLTPDRVTWQGGDFLEIVPLTAATFIETTGRVGVPISTTAGARNNRVIEIRMKNNTPGRDFVVSWITDEDPSYDHEKEVTFSESVSSRDTEYHTYRFTMTSALWRGTLRSLQIGPVGAGDVTGAGNNISIDYIRVQDDQTTPNVAKAWEFREGQTVRYQGAGAGDNYTRWEGPNELLRGTNDTTTDSVFEIDQARYNASREFSFATLAQGSPGNQRLQINEIRDEGDGIARIWNFAVDKMFWTALSNVSEFAWARDGSATTVGGTITGNNSAVVSGDNLSIPIERRERNVIHFKLKNSSRARTARVWFVTNENPTYALERSRTVTITAESTYTEYTVDFSETAGWRSSTLRQIRIDPSDEETVTTGSFKLDRVWMDRPEI